MHYGVGKFFAKPGVVLGQRAQQLLHVLALSVFVGRAGVVYHWQVARVTYYVAFLDVNHGAYQRNACARHVTFRRKGVEPSFVKQAEHKCFHNVVHVVPQRKFVVARRNYFAVQRAAPHFCAQAAWVLFFAQVKDNLGNVRLYNAVLYAQFATVVAYGRVGVVGKAHVDGYAHQVKFSVAETLKFVQQRQQSNAVLAAAYAYGNFVTVFDKVVVVYRTSHRRK